MTFLSGSRGKIFRHRMEYEVAKVHLESLAKHKAIESILGNMKCVSTHHEKKGTRVSFNFTPQVVEFNNKLPATATINRFPSLINDLTEEQFVSECFRLNMIYDETKKDQLKNDICKNWSNYMSDVLEDNGIDITTIKDEDIEAMYNLWKSINRSALLLQSESDLFPQTMSNEDIIQNLNNRHMNLKEGTSREDLIRNLENALLQEIDCLDSPYFDYGKKKVTGEDIFVYKYGFASKAQMAQEISNRGMTPPKTIIARKKMLVDILDKELKNTYYACYIQALVKCLEYRHIYEHKEEETLSTLFIQLFQYKKENQEIINIELD
ncbi:hypothetical protein WA158_005015 [Blastocystis sp. Blastoise]